MAKGNWKPAQHFNTSSMGKDVILYLFEVWAGGDDLVNEVLHGENVILSESSFDDSIVGQRDALLVNLAVSTFVDQFTD